MPDPFQGLMPSVLDRLIDAESAGTPTRQGYTLSQMEDAVRRDLEDLLNTRRPVVAHFELFCPAIPGPRRLKGTTTDRPAR